jgi:membrane protein required for colicin V production
VDGLLLVLIAGFALRGWFRGLLLEMFSLLGLVAGMIAASAVFQYVGDHWVNAQPAWIYAVLRVLVAALVGVALVSVFHLIGVRVREAARHGVIAAVDGPLGLIAGAAIGVMVAVLLLVGALLTPWPPELGRFAAKARLALPALSAGERVLQWSSPVPGARWLRSRVEAASRRARARGATAPTSAA